MASIFTKILRAEIPSHRILEDEHYFAFLDIRPINPGHTLVIPKQEVDQLFDLDPETLGGLLIFAQRVARAMHQAVDCLRIGVIVAGLEVPHAHVHLIPIVNGEGDLSFSRARPAEAEELAELAERIRSHLS
jgi:histidine triad (HIT) family protein